MLNGRRKPFGFPLTAGTLVVLSCLAAFQIVQASHSKPSSPLTVTRWAVTYTAPDGQSIQRDIAAPEGWSFFEVATKGPLRLEMRLPACTTLSGYRFLAGPYDDLDRLPKRWVMSVLRAGAGWTISASERRGAPYRHARWYFFPLHGSACVSALRLDLEEPMGSPIFRLYSLQPIETGHEPS